MNINKDGILITCSGGTYLNLYEIKGKKYKNIQTIKPYTLLNEIIGIFDDSFSIQKFIELKNGDIAILVWGYAICFYQKKKNSKKYSYLNKYLEKTQNYTDLCELDNNQYCISLKYSKKVQFLDMNLKIIINEIQIGSYFSDSKNQLLLMNEKDLFVLGKEEIFIIDAQKEVMVKKIKIEAVGYISFIYRLSNNIILIGYWNNYIEQLKYDEIEKELKIISNTEQKSHSGFALYDVSSISIYNDLIVSPYDNVLEHSSLIIYKLKKI